MAADSVDPTVDLDAPARLLARWGTVAAAGAVLPLDLARAEPGRLSYEDGGGSWATLELPGAGRAIFFGLDRDGSDTPFADPPIDLLQDGPGWLPWPELIALAGDDALGWCFWHDDGVWRRSPSAARASAVDGHATVAAWVLDDPSTVAEISGMSHPAPPLPHEPIAALLTRAHERAVTAADLAAALGDPGPDALAGALEIATGAGLTGGPSPLPAPVPGGDSAPPGRRRRRISEHAHAAMVAAAMRGNAEFGRPVPADSRALRRLRDWVAGHGELITGDGSVIVQSTGAETTASGLAPGGLEELARRVADLRRAERDPHHGCWIWLRLTREVTRGRLGRERVEVHVARAYDHAPAWVPEGREPLWLNPLRAEMADRDPRFRPDWARLLDDEGLLSEEV